MLLSTVVFSSPPHPNPPPPLHLFTVHFTMKQMTQYPNDYCVKTDTMKLYVLQIHQATLLHHVIEMCGVLSEIIQIIM